MFGSWFLETSLIEQAHQEQLREQRPREKRTVTETGGSGRFLLSQQSVEKTSNAEQGQQTVRKTPGMSVSTFSYLTVPEWISFSSILLIKKNKFLPKKTGLSQSRESKSKSPTWVAGAKYLSPHLLSPKLCISRKLRGGAEPGIEPRHFDKGHRHLS